jgi:protein-S-isoprenylcysteine O-methyltransferase Ste14
MTLRLEFWPTLAFAVVIFSWCVFVVVFLVQRKPASAPDSKRDRSSIPGIVLQGLSYAIVWSIKRTAFTSIISASKAFEIVIAVLTIVLAIGSVWFVSAAVRALGKQWSIGARLLEGHKLITQGPYNVVRNPIYTGMLGMLLATGLAISHWLALAMAIVVFAIGTTIRVRSEEKLLRGAFGAEFEKYAREVSAVIPFLI